MSKIDLIDNSWVDLVFEGKNKKYGAYQLRKDTGKRNVKAMILVFATIITIMVALWAKVAIENALPKKVAIETDVELSQLAQKKEAKVERKEPVKVEMEQKVVEKVKSSVKFTAPEIKKDDEVKPEDELKSQDELAKSTTAIGSFDVKGNDESEGEVLKAKEVIAQELPKEEEKVFDVVEQMPSFPGGPQALFEYLSKNIKYPAVAEENGVQGRVIVTFVVERDGSITDVKVIKSVDLTPGGIFDAYKADITVWGRANLVDVEDSNLGLKGSPTQIAKASDKVRKGAGEKVTLDPTEAVDYIIDKLKVKHVI